MSTLADLGQLWRTSPRQGELFELKEEMARLGHRLKMIDSLLRCAAVPFQKPAEVEAAPGAEGWMDGALGALVEFLELIDAQGRVGRSVLKPDHGQRQSQP